MCRRHKILVAYVHDLDYRAVGTQYCTGKRGIACLRHIGNNLVIVATGISSPWDGEHPYSEQLWS